jgi:PRTRC genetic system protein C
MATRIFKYQDQTWEDPGEGFSNEDVKKHLTQFFPELAQATIEVKELDDGSTEVRFVKKAGTKGAKACEIGAHGLELAGYCYGALYVRAGGMHACERHVRLLDAFVQRQTGQTFTEWYADLSAVDREVAVVEGTTMGWQFVTDQAGTCVYCGEPVYSEGLEPPMCERHYELALLMSRCERQGHEVTAENVIQRMKAATFAVWHIAEAEVAGLLSGMVG